MQSIQFIVLLLSSLQLLANAAPFSNPLKYPNGSDPYLVYHEGYYYLTTTTWTDVQITRATTLEGLKTGEVQVVWNDDEPSRCCSVWAPEFHQLDGVYVPPYPKFEWQIVDLMNRWYLYYTAGSSDTLDNQRVHVLKGESPSHSSPRTLP